MRDHDHGCMPVEECFTVAVEMNDVGLDLALQCAQAVASMRDIFTLRVLPFQRQIAFDQARSVAADPPVIDVVRGNQLPRASVLAVQGATTRRSARVRCGYTSSAGGRRASA